MVLTRKFSIPESIAFLIPFQSLGFEFGLLVWPFYIPLIIAIIMSGLKSTPIFVDKRILIYLLYVIISTIVISLFFIEYSFVNSDYSSFFRNNGRFISYLGKIILFQLGIVIIISNAIKNKVQFRRIIRVYLQALTILAVIAFAQLAIFIATGINITPMGIRKDVVVEPMVRIFSSISFPRLNSLGGEPKALGASLAVGIALLYYSSQHQLNLIKRTNILMALFIFILFCTVSTGGIGLFLIFIAANIVRWFIISIKKIKFKKSFLILAPILVFIMVLGRGPLNTLVKTRFVDRPIGAEADDATIQAFLKAEPKWWIFGPGSGNLAQVASPYIPDAFKHFTSGNILNSRYGHIKIISENGLIGLLLFLLIYISLLFKMNKLKASPYRYEAKFLIKMILILLLFYFARANYVYPPFLFITGLGFALIRMAHVEKMKNAQALRIQ